MIDDWNCPNVRNATKKAFEKLNYKVLFEKNLFTENFNNKNGWGSGNFDTWWDGLYIALVQK
jgi:hypothetical protein